ncbi:hypothetical protein KBC40_02105 [Patescibacteria group bacterium]|nr:hypothetical protein [Patescibacteria group bacterium]
MIEVMQRIWELSIHFLQNLDPSLFQNVIIGILMVLIFIGEQIFSEVKIQEKRGEFSKMVIFYEIFNVTRIAVLSIFSIFIISFFKDSIDIYQIHSVGLKTKIIIIIFVAFVSFVLIRPIFKFQVFFRGKRHKFEIDFLKSLNFLKIFSFRNLVKAEKMIRAWNSFWSERSEFNERDFTKIFISHIEDAVKYKKFELVVQLAQTYVNNIEKRDRFSIGYEILPKIFEWNEIFWNEQQLWVDSYAEEEIIQKFFPQKYFPTFRNWALKLYKKINPKRDIFWNWYYFGSEFFQAIIKILLKDGNDSYQLFSSFKKHIKESEQKLEKMDDGKNKEKYSIYITGLFESFCPTFFNEIYSAPSSYSIWEHDFPVEWKIIAAKKDSRIAFIILGQFLSWSQNRIFKNSEENFDKDLTEVINGIFPNVHSPLFTAFLMLYFSSDKIKYALLKKPNFHILGRGVQWSGPYGEDLDDRNRRVDQMMQEKNISEKQETIQIILEFFHFWSPLKWYADDLQDDELKNWSEYTDEKRKIIISGIQKNKLETIKIETDSDEIIEICKNSVEKERYRKDLLELIQSLILEIEKNKRLIKKQP